jgi:hypothetical protein
MGLRFDYLLRKSVSILDQFNHPVFTKTDGPDADATRQQLKASKAVRTPLLLSGKRPKDESGQVALSGKYG